MVAIVAGLLPDSIVAGGCKGFWGFWRGGIENKGDSGLDCVSMAKAKLTAETPRRREERF
jgi:hypothetical protein